MIGLVLETHRHPDRVVQQMTVRAVGVNVRGDHALSLISPEHHRAGAVTKQHAGAAVIPVEHSREGLGANHQRGLGRAGLDEFLRHAERVDEPGASGIDVKGRAFLDPQAILQQAGSAGEDHIRRGGADDDQIDL